MRSTLFILTVFSLLAGHQARADVTWDHMGTSFALQTITYGIAEQFLSIGTHQECTYNHYKTSCEYLSHKKVFNRTEAVIFSAAITFAATFAYSYAKTLHNTPLSGTEVLSNVIGQTVGISTIYAFHF